MNSKLDKFLEEYKEKEINICIHDTPDPDAVGAALGLQFILKNHDIISNIYYRGEISHPQNKTIMNILDITMEKTSKDIEGNNACVDCTPANSCAKDAVLVIDHHKATSKAKYSKVLPAYGASSTIIWNIIKELKVELKKSDEEVKNVSTALLLGIRTDTNDLISENISKEDFVAYQELLEYADNEVLQKAMKYPLPRYLYEKRINLYTEGNFYEANGIFAGGIGFITAAQRDAISILSEEYSRMESVSTAIIFAITDSMSLEVSIRSTNVSLDVNQLCKDLFGEYGGGGSYKGGAKLPLNFYSDIDVEHKEDLWKITCTHMFKKVFKEDWKKIEVAKKIK